VAFFEAYFDESGTHKGSPIMVVGGAMARHSSWVAICAKWESVLKKYNIQYFHATDVNNRRRQFKEWDDKRSVAFYTKLLKILQEETLLTIGIAIELSTYEKVLSEFRGMTISPYQFCLKGCAYTVSSIATHKKYMQPVSVVFEKGQKRNPRNLIDINWLCENENDKGKSKINKISFADKKEATPLQVADLLSYEFFRFYSVGGQEYSQFRFPLRSLAKHIKVHKGVLMGETLIREGLQIYNRKPWC